MFQVDEEHFTRVTAAEGGEMYGRLPEVTKMILLELRALPEYEQLRLLADLKERRAKGGEK